ncbi:hypothetical protein EJ06DRAFT_524766 [Trichodelitschia bisporula]|uniref:Uncharacterized protein n=1 Tax=Trichodelitschia bisporula TaxID=703511 RepID=A0A6G1HKG1_9PEZI|nr:hypothetical protein EJ06DRAFT_524766 [Trichodelitschia bisporula]
MFNYTFTDPSECANAASSSSNHDEPPPETSQRVARVVLVNEELLPQPFARDNTTTGNGEGRPATTEQRLARVRQAFAEMQARRGGGVNRGDRVGPASNAEPLKGGEHLLRAIVTYPETEEGRHNTNTPASADLTMPPPPRPPPPLAPVSQDTTVGASTSTTAQPQGTFSSMSHFITTTGFVQGWLIPAASLDASAPLPDTQVVYIPAVPGTTPLPLHLHLSSAPPPAAPARSSVDHAGLAAAHADFQWHMRNYMRTPAPRMSNTGHTREHYAFIAWIMRTGAVRRLVLDILSRESEVASPAPLPEAEKQRWIVRLLTTYNFHSEGPITHDEIERSVPVVERRLREADIVLGVVAMYCLNTGYPGGGRIEAVVREALATHDVARELVEDDEFYLRYGEGLYALKEQLRGSVEGYFFGDNSKQGGCGGSSCEARPEGAIADSRPRSPPGEGEEPARKRHKGKERAVDT